jgi:hypothetical protein
MTGRTSLNRILLILCYATPEIAIHTYKGIDIKFYPLHVCPV